MGIGEQFSGLDMKNLIGGPLTAAAESSITLARSTAQFINEVGFDKDNKTRTVLFKYTQKTPDPDGNFSDNEMAVDVPLLAIVPIPNLQIDEVNILFDMEVKTSEKSEEATDMGASLEAKVGWGPVSVSIKGNVSSHSSNTRSSDNSAKYHVDVRATNHGIPEGLARVLDMMAASVSPTLISSRATDASGNELKGDSLERNRNLKAAREEIFRLEDIERAANDNYTLKLGIFKDRAKVLRTKETDPIHDEILKATEEEKSDKMKKLSECETKWDDVINSIADTIVTHADPDKDENFEAISDVKGLDNEFKAVKKAYLDLRTATGNLNNKKSDYNSLMVKGKVETNDVKEA